MTLKQSSFGSKCAPSDKFFKARPSAPPHPLTPLLLELTIVAHSSERFYISAGRALVYHQLTFLNLIGRTRSRAACSSRSCSSPSRSRARTSRRPTGTRRRATLSTRRINELIRSRSRAAHAAIYSRAHPDTPGAAHRRVEARRRQRGGRAQRVQVHAHYH